MLEGMKKKWASIHFFFIKIATECFIYIFYYHTILSYPDWVQIILKWTVWSGKIILILVTGEWIIEEKTWISL